MQEIDKCVRVSVAILITSGCWGVCVVQLNAPFIEWGVPRSFQINCGKSVEKWSVQIYYTKE